MDTDETSYRQIAKSTSIFGGSQLANILIGIVRTKVLAVLLGTTGVGLNSMFQSIVELVRSFTGLGLGFSSVKEIAEAKQSGDSERIGHTVTMLHRWLWLTGIIGLLLTIGLSPWISEYVFGDRNHLISICLISFSVLAGTVSSGQLALLQGMRKIASMAKASLYGAIGGLLTAVPLYWIFGLKGIVPALLAVSFIGLFFTWFFARRIKVEKVVQTYRESLKRGGGMVHLGIYTVVSGLVSTLTLFLLRSFILQSDGVGHVGLFQAVWSVSNMYMGGIMTAMAVDYFPRLCSMNGDDPNTVRFTNEQTRFVLIVATPLIVLMLLVAPPILNLLYSNGFNAASSLLRWQIFGTFLKVIIWPLGFILLSKGKGARFLIVESTWFIAYYIATRLLWPHYGLDAAGIAYVIAYVIYIPLVYLLVQPLCNFHFGIRNKVLIFLFGLFAVGTFLSTLKLDGINLRVIGTILFLTCSIWAAFELNKIIPFTEWSDKIAKLFKLRRS
ncbi:MAG TPA: O-antigen translocase [Bacteroidales bacterium]|nr:O-antigen translocase [Bacteroidales bacterium]